MMLTLAETAPAQIAVVNPPSAMASNDSKPAQLAQLEDLGFLVPDTIVTNDREIAEDFWARHGAVVCKSPAVSAASPAPSPPLTGTGSPASHLPHPVPGIHPRRRLPGARRRR